MFDELAPKGLMTIQTSGLHLLKSRDDFLTVFLMCGMLKTMCCLMRLAV